MNALAGTGKVRMSSLRGPLLLVALIWASHGILGCKSDVSPTEAAAAETNAPTVAAHPGPAVTASLVGVRRSRDDHWGFGHEVSYLVALARDDGQEGTLLEPKLLYGTALGLSKTMCDRPRRPHACTFRLEEGQAEPASLGLAVTFADGLSAVLNLEVPPVPALGAPEIAEMVGTQPGSTSLEVGFANTGAKRYRVIAQIMVGEPGGGKPFDDVDVVVLLRQSDGTYARSDERHGLPGYEVTIEQDTEKIVVRASGAAPLDGPLAVLAVCADDAVPVPGTELQANLHECAIERLEAPSAQ